MISPCRRGRGLYAILDWIVHYYDQITDVGRDQNITRQALQAFRIVIEQYPDSEYARSALKFDLAFDHLAGKDGGCGRYCLGRKNYAAAINRFRNVEIVKPPHMAEALHRLVEAYLSLGLTDQAQTARPFLVPLIDQMV